MVYYCFFFCVEGGAFRGKKQQVGYYETAGFIFNKQLGVAYDPAITPKKIFCFMQGLANFLFQL